VQLIYFVTSGNTLNGYFLLILVDAKYCFAKNYLSWPGECHKNEPEKHSQKSMQSNLMYFGPIDRRAKRPFPPMIILQPEEIRS
jgi:hypothetical protein